MNDDWMDRAACASAPNKDVFFPHRDDSSREKYSAARRICARCPVQSPCVAYAISNGITFGMWGGLTYHQRRRLTPEQKDQIFQAAREEVIS